MGVAACAMGGKRGGGDSHHHNTTTRERTTLSYRVALSRYHGPHNPQLAGAQPQRALCPRPKGVLSHERGDHRAASGLGKTSGHANGRAE